MSLKPTLTASQAYTAYKNGNRTNEVLTAMQYYYGIGGSTDGTRSPGSLGGYDNGTLSTAEIKQLQTYLNQFLPEGQKLDIDGFWGPATKAAAGGYSADEYMRVYREQQAKKTGLWNTPEYK